MSAARILSGEYGRSMLKPDWGIKWGAVVACATSLITCAAIKNTV